MEGEFERLRIAESSEYFIESEVSVAVVICVECEENKREDSTLSSRSSFDGSLKCVIFLPPTVLG